MRADDLVPGSENPNGKRICDLDDEYIRELLSEYPTVDCDDKSNDSSNEDTNSDEDSDRNDSSKEDTNRKKLKNCYNHLIDFF